MGQLLENLSQYWMILFGAVGIWLLSRRGEYRNWGYLINLISQPAFLYSSWYNGQWGLFLLSAWYTWSWWVGVYNHLILEGKIKCVLSLLRKQ